MELFFFFLVTALTVYMCLGVEDIEHVFDLRTAECGERHRFVRSTVCSCTSHCAVESLSLYMCL